MELEKESSNAWDVLVGIQWKAKSTMAKVSEWLDTRTTTNHFNQIKLSWLLLGGGVGWEVWGQVPKWQGVCNTSLSLFLLMKNKKNAYEDERQRGL